jgi:hypothetical protein
LATTLATLLYASTVQNATDDRITETDIFDTTATEQDYGMFLEVMTLSWDISCHFHAIRQTDASDLTDSGVRLLWCLGRNLHTNAALERRWKV